MQQRQNATLRDILYIFFKNTRIIAIIFLTSVIIATVYSFTAVPLYTAETKLLVKMGKEKFSALEDYSKTSYNVLFQERSQNINNEIEILENPALTKALYPVLKEKLKQVPVITEKTVLGVFMTVVSNAFSFAKRVIMIPFDILGLTRHLSADEQLMLAFQSSLDVEYLEDTDMLKLSFTWKDPEFAAFAVNTYAKEYLYQRTQVHKSEDSYEFYVDQIQLYDRKLTDVENQLQEFISRGGIANIELQKELLLKTIAELETRYNDALIEYQQALIKLQSVKNMYRKPGVWIETPDIGEDVSDKQAYLRELDTAYFSLKLERERLLKRYTPSAREVRSIDVQLSNLRDQKAESLINILEMDLETSESNKDSLSGELTENRKRLEKLNSLTFRLQQLERARSIAKDNFVLYKKKAEDLRIFDSLDKRLITSVKILSPALPPIAPSHPKKALIIGMAAFLGLFLGFGFASINEFFNHAFRDEYDISGFLDIPLLMSVAYIPGAPAKGTGQGPFKRLLAAFRRPGKARQRPPSPSGDAAEPQAKSPSLLGRIGSRLKRAGSGRNKTTAKTLAALLACLILVAAAAEIITSRSGMDTASKRRPVPRGPAPAASPDTALSEQTDAAVPVQQGLPPLEKAVSPSAPEAPGDRAAGASPEPDTEIDESKEPAPEKDAASAPSPEPGADRPADTAPAARQQPAPDAAAGKPDNAAHTKPAQKTSAPRPAEHQEAYYTVQVSTERVKDNVDAFVRQLSREGYPVYVVERSTRSGETLYKIRIGAFDTKQRAAHTASSYHAETGKPYLIVRSTVQRQASGESEGMQQQPPAPGDREAGASSSGPGADSRTAFSPGHHFTVQINSYARKPNALRERDRLQGAGHSPYIVTEDIGGKTLHKVCTGLFETRSRAVEYKKTHNLTNAIIVRCSDEQQN